VASLSRRKEEGRVKEGAGEERREEARRDAWNALVVPFCTYMHYYTVLAHNVHLWRWDRLADARPRGGAATSMTPRTGHALGGRLGAAARKRLSLSLSLSHTRTLIYLLS
jgi:hypothetical protein